MNDSTIKTTGVFGLAGNPPHIGHLDVIWQGCAAFDSVLVVPNYRHAFGKQLAPFATRVQLLRNLLAEHAPGSLDKGRVAVSEVEQELAAGNGSGAIFTYDLLTCLTKRFPGQRFTFIVGPDNAAQWPRFHFAAAIETRWGIFVAKENLGVRSTIVRELAAQLAGNPDNEALRERLALLVGTANCDRIINEHLYREEI